MVQTMPELIASQACYLNRGLWIGIWDGVWFLGYGFRICDLDWEWGFGLRVGIEILYWELESGIGESGLRLVIGNVE